MYRVAVILAFLPLGGSGSTRFAADAVCELTGFVDALLEVVDLGS